MNYSVLVRPNSSKNEVSAEEDSLIVRITDLPLEGKANSKVIKLLSKYFHIVKSEIAIVSGAKSRKKIIRIENAK